MVGGGLVGCETALHLSKNNKKVTVIEIKDELAPDGYFSERLHTIDHMENDENITAMTGTKCLEIADGYVLAEQNDKTIKLECDSVVIASGMRARTDLADSFKGTAFDVIPVGDCVRASNLREATWTGYNAATII